ALHAITDVILFFQPACKGLTLLACCNTDDWRILMQLKRLKDVGVSPQKVMSSVVPAEMSRVLQWPLESCYNLNLKG
ncbi:MAG: hypothetical protein ACXWZE_20690, partial [Candidatus Binatia bacterium]